MYILNRNTQQRSFRHLGHLGRQEKREESRHVSRCTSLPQKVCEESIQKKRSIPTNEPNFALVDRNAPCAHSKCAKYDEIRTLLSNSCVELAKSRARKIVQPRRTYPLCTLFDQNSSWVVRNMTIRESFYRIFVSNRKSAGGAVKTQ